MTPYFMLKIGPWKWWYLDLKQVEKHWIPSAFVCINHAIYQSNQREQASYDPYGLEHQNTLM